MQYRASSTIGRLVEGGIVIQNNNRVFFLTIGQDIDNKIIKMLDNLAYLY